MTEIRFSEKAQPHEIKYDAEWRQRNGELLDRAKEIQESNPIMALALINRFDEFEGQRLSWKLNILTRITNEEERNKIAGNTEENYSLGH